VPAGIVDDLELVEIQINDGVRLLRQSRGENTLQPALELPAIDEPGQRIVRSLVAQLVRRSACLGNIAKNQYASYFRTLVVVDRGGRIVYRDLMSVTADQQRIARKANDLTFL
jgi:hypothetical protein